MKNKYTYSVSTACKLVNFPGGPKVFFKWLRDMKYLQQNNEPYQKYRERGWFILVGKQVKIGKHNSYKPVTRFTMNGIVGIEKVVLKKFPPCLPCAKSQK